MYAKAVDNLETLLCGTCISDKNCIWHLPSTPLAGHMGFLHLVCHYSLIMTLPNYLLYYFQKKKVRKKSRVCHNHKPQPFPDTKSKRKPTNPNKHKSNKRTKSTKISSLFPKRGNRNTKRTEKHKNKITHGKTYNKSPRRINHKATKRKTNTGTTALELSTLLQGCFW